MPWKKIRSEDQISFVTEEKIGEMAELAMSEQDALLLWTMFYSGMGHVEVLKLRARDLLPDGTLSVSHRRKRGGR